MTQTMTRCGAMCLLLLGASCTQPEEQFLAQDAQTDVRLECRTHVENRSAARLLAVLASCVPNFAGLAVGGDGAPVLLIAGGSDQVSVDPALARLVRESIIVSAATLRVASVQFSYTQLRDWKACLVRHATSRSETRVDLEHVSLLVQENKLLVGLQHTTRPEILKGVLGSCRIPQDAVTWRSRSGV